MCADVLLMCACVHVYGEHILDVSAMKPFHERKTQLRNNLDAALDTPRPVSMSILCWLYNPPNKAWKNDILATSSGLGDHALLRISYLFKQVYAL